MGGQHSGRTVVVGIDGSTSALKAVRWAAAEAARRNVRLRVVTAFASSQDRIVGRAGLEADYHEIMPGGALRLLDEAAALAAEVLPEERVESQLVAGFPIPVLRAESRDAELLVVGDRGYGAISALLVGSVAAATASHAECPVVLVRSEQGTAVHDRRPVEIAMSFRHSPPAAAVARGAVRPVPGSTLSPRQAQAPRVRIPRPSPSRWGGRR